MSRKYGQAGQPAGFMGRLLGRIMAWHNRTDNEWTLELLGISNAENILEIGYGPGNAIQMAHALCPECRIIGIDHSEEMLKAASRVNKDAIAGGSVDLRLGDVGRLDFSDAAFDKAFSINSIYFWPDPIHGLQELHRALKVGGKLAITVRDKKRKAYQPYNKDNLNEMLSRAGFSKVEIHSNGLPFHPLLCGIGFK